MRHRHRSRNPTGRGVAAAVAVAVAEVVAEVVAQAVAASAVASAVAAAAVAAGRSSKRGDRNRQPLVLREARIENRLGGDWAGGRKLAAKGGLGRIWGLGNTGSAATIRPLPPHPSPGQPLWLSSCCSCVQQRRSAPFASCWAEAEWARCESV
jgi:hypothetical protein